MIGYQWARSIAEYVEVVVVTHHSLEMRSKELVVSDAPEAVYLDFEAQARRSGKIAKRFKLSAAGTTFVNYPMSIAFERGGLATVPV